MLYEKLLRHAVSLFVIAGCVLFVSTNHRGAIVSAKSEGNKNVLLAPEILGTATLFREQIQESKKITPYKTVRKMDPQRDACDRESLIQEGKNGERRIYKKIVYYDDKKYSEEALIGEITSPVDRILVKGSKRIYKTAFTSDGKISYWCKLDNFLATEYDKNCHGCDEWTAIGMKQGYGVVAVDPKIIPLRTKLYIPGYGMAVAGDTGGKIKGERIDLGFESADGKWGRRYVDVYLVN